MPGSYALSKIQLGQEGTPGNGVAASTIWRGMGSIDDEREPQFPDENIGLISPTNRSYIPQHGGAISFASVPATFQQLRYLFEASIAAATPTADGAGTDYIYTYDAPTTAVASPRTFTIEAGDNQQAREMEHGFITDWTIEGSAGEAVMMSAEWQGEGPTKTTFTAALTIPTVYDMLFQLFKIYIDDVGGSFGTTQLTETLLSFSMSYSSGLIRKYTADGSLDFSFIQSTRPELEVSVVFEHNATAVAEQDNWEAGTPRLLRLENTHNANQFATPGTAYTYPTFIADIAGTWTDFEPLGEQDGNSIVAATFRGAYDPTAAAFAQFVLAVEEATLP